MQYQAPRGTYDILPEDQPWWQYIQNEASDICRCYGYRRIDTPVFEDAGLFVRSIGGETDIVRKEMYSFEDRGGELLTLRPEGTASVCRAYLEHGMHNLPQPVKLLYIAPIFRYERPQSGRFRQHWQFGAEAIGSDDPALDAEILDMAWGFYQRLGLKDLALKVNSIGCPDCRPGYLKALRSYYEPLADRLCADCRRRLVENTLRVLDCKNDACMALAEGAPKGTEYLCGECAEHFDSVKKYILILGLDFQIDHRLVRGLDYYTRTVFEFQPPGARGAQSTIGGGGRYDRLIGQLGGQPTPAVGFGTGLERLILNLKEQGISVPAQSSPDVYVACLGSEAKQKGMEYARQLRRDGSEVIMAFGNRSLKAQMRQANTLKADYTIVIGEDELKDEVVALRNMADGKQERIGFELARQRIRNQKGENSP